MARRLSPRVFRCYRRFRIHIGPCNSLDLAMKCSLAFDPASVVQSTIRRSVADVVLTDYHCLMTQPYDLRYDPNEVGADMVVECWISHGPRRDDPSFVPMVGEFVLLGDDELEARSARVIRREGNRVWVQLALPQNATAVA